MKTWDDDAAEQGVLRTTFSAMVSPVDRARMRTNESADWVRPTPLRNGVDETREVVLFDAGMFCFAKTMDELRRLYPALHPAHLPPRSAAVDPTEAHAKPRSGFSVIRRIETLRARSLDSLDQI